MGTSVCLGGGWDLKAKQAWGEGVIRNTGRQKRKRRFHRLTEQAKSVAKAYKVIHVDAIATAVLAAEEFEADAFPGGAGNAVGIWLWSTRNQSQIPGACSTNCFSLQLKE